MNRLCLFLRPCICTHIYACVFTSTWTVEGWWFVVYSISCIFSALQRRDWWISTRFVELPQTNSLPSDDFLFHGWDLLAPRVRVSLLVQHCRTSKALQWSSAAWALKCARERDQLPYQDHFLFSWFTQIKLRLWNLPFFWLSLWTLLFPLAASKVFHPWFFSSRNYNLRPCQITEHVYAADLPGRSLGTYVRKLNRETWGKDVLHMQWWVWEILEV